jgi:hypothetical protein
MAGLAYRISEFLKAHIRMQVKMRQVKTVRISPGLRDARIVVATNIYNERDRVDFFVEYYKSLGVSEFIILDNSSTDGLGDHVIGRDGISLFSTSGAYNRSRYGIDWMNSIFAEYCCGKWVLYVDADEFFVYPNQDSMALPELVGRLEGGRRRAMSCLMVDIYSQGAVWENVCPAGANPMKVCPYFDRSGYDYYYDQKNYVTWVKGGVRGRVFFKDNATNGPALNKIPLVQWRRWYAYVKSTHEMTPSYLNRTYLDIDFAHGALMHAKFLAKFTETSQDKELLKKHTDEYRSYTKDSLSKSFYDDEISAKFLDWRSLEDCGLIGGSALVQEFCKAKSCRPTALR